MSLCVRMCVCACVHVCVRECMCFGMCARVYAQMTVCLPVCAYGCEPREMLAAYNIHETCTLDIRLLLLMPQSILPITVIQ